MILITIKYEKDEHKPRVGEVVCAGSEVVLLNSQNGAEARCYLRPTEAVTHHLRLDAMGIVKLEIKGCP